jgi:hypothetical protein
MYYFIPHTHTQKEEEEEEEEEGNEHVLFG